MGSGKAGKMAMTKAEKKLMDDAAEDIELARALASAIVIIGQQEPSPMTEDEIKSALIDGGMRHGSRQRVARGWFVNEHAGRLTLGCSTGYSHSSSGDVTTSQNMGRMYRTVSDALFVLRRRRALAAAKSIAAVYRKVESDE